MAQNPDAVGFVSTVSRDKSFSRLLGIALFYDDTLLVSDAAKHCIWRVDPSLGKVASFGGVAGKAGYDDGGANESLFNRPSGLFVDGACIFVADEGNNRIRLVCRGVVSTSAGHGYPQKYDGMALQARFASPSGICAAHNAGTPSTSHGSILVTESDHVRAIGSEGQVTTVARSANFYNPQQVTLGNDGSIYVADYGSSTVQRIKNERVQPIVEKLSSPQGIATDGKGNLFVSDFSANKIYKISSEGEKEVLCGSGKNESVDGQGTEASLSGPHFLHYDAASGYLYFTEDQAIRKVKVEQLPSSHHDPNLSLDLSKLIDNGDMPSEDVVEFLVEEKIVRVARAALCIRSEYFSKMLQSGWKESQTGESKGVVLIEGATYDAFHALITFLVTGFIDTDKCQPIMRDILLLADQYLARDLRELCMKQLVKEISMETVLDFLFLSEKYGFEVLMETCLKFAAKGIKDLRYKESFQDLSRDILTKIFMNLEIA